MPIKWGRETVKLMPSDTKAEPLIPAHLNLSAYHVLALRGCVDDCPDAYTFLNQRIAVPQMLAEARRRLDSEPRDDTEYFEGQLAQAALGAYA